MSLNPSIPVSPSGCWGIGRKGSRVLSTPGSVVRPSSEAVASRVAVGVCLWIPSGGSGSQEHRACPELTLQLLLAGFCAVQALYPLSRKARLAFVGPQEVTSPQSWNTILR